MRPGGHAVAALAYAVLALVITFPLVTRLSTGVPAGWGDPLLNTWILWWNASTVPLTDAWWNAPAFFPAEGVLAYSENLLGLTPITSPIIWITGDAQLAYNVALVLTFALSATAAYFLGLELTGRRDAAFVGGLLFGFAPYRIDQAGHIQVLASFYMPLALLGLHRYVRTERARWLALFAVAWLLQSLTNGYFLFFFSLLVAAWLAWFLPWRRWQMVARVAVAWALAAIAIAPVLLGYRAVHLQNDFTRSREVIESFAADLMALLSPPDALTFWQFLEVFERPEGGIFPGVTGLLLVTAAILVVRLRRSDAGWLRWVSRLSAASAVVFFAVAVSAVRAPWRTSILGLSVSARDQRKPILMAVIFLIVALATSPRLRDAIGRRSVLAFYALAAFVSWTLCLGPSPTLFGKPGLPAGPYGLLEMIPGLDALRVPPRFAMITALCLSTAAALAFARIVQLVDLRGTWLRRACLASVVVLALADTWTGPFQIDPLPKVSAIQRHETGGPVLELPIVDPLQDTLVMYRHIGSRRPVVNGSSGNSPAWYQPLRDRLSPPDPEIFGALSALGVENVVIDVNAPQASAWQPLLAASGSLVAAEGSRALYRLHPPRAGGLATSRPLGPRVTIGAIRASVNESLVPSLTDGDLSTRWHSAAQAGDESLTIDLVRPVDVAAVVLDLGPSRDDAPVDLAIETSDDGQAWTTVWRGGGRMLAFVGLVRDPRAIPSTFDIGDRTARFIRLRQLGADPVYYWSVAELAILAPHQPRRVTGG